MTLSVDAVIVLAERLTWRRESFCFDRRDSLMQNICDEIDRLKENSFLCRGLQST